MRKRRWFYVGALVAIALPPIQIALTLLSVGFSSSDQMIISAVGIFLLAPFVVADFVVWCWRGFNGLQRLIPMGVVGGVILLAYLMTDDEGLWCIAGSPDFTVCYPTQGIIVQYLALVTMVAALFIDREDTQVEEPAVSEPAS